MNALAKRLAKLESRAGPGGYRYFFLPYDLTDTEEALWHEQHTSPEARAAAGISPNITIAVVRWYGDRDGIPRGLNTPSEARRPV